MSDVEGGSQMVGVGVSQMVGEECQAVEGRVLFGRGGFHMVIIILLKVFVFMGFCVIRFTVYSQYRTS